MCDNVSGENVAEDSEWVVDLGVGGFFGAAAAVDGKWVWAILYTRAHKMFLG